MARLEMALIETTAKNTGSRTFATFLKRINTTPSHPNTPPPCIFFEPLLEVHAVSPGELGATFDLVQY
jgi:hypothetical protein